ncbi:NADH-quinone oxidoreductase subunit K [Marinimicrobium alkaliphilum]|uniref:NADH-quinone oxidoreductase subunit K n=1 Tax=Marinimicrobium alkaliphilum TaxID=2202654 RepID=UPI000DB9A661|nr:NADH-quinone oxidoreductase subunit K [Marinimicrobium alkaliphilum]
MTQSLLFLVVGVCLWVIGLYGLLRVRHVIRRLIAVNIMGGGAFTVMVAIAVRTDPVDPVFQALVVTGLVVAVSATAFALRLASAEAHCTRRRESRP